MKPSHAQFSADDIMTILRASEEKSGCTHCGRKHVLSYGSKFWCQTAHHPFHGPTGPLSPGEKEIAAMFPVLPPRKSIL